MIHIFVQLCPAVCLSVCQELLAGMPLRAPKGPPANKGARRARKAPPGAEQAPTEKARRQTDGRTDELTDGAPKTHHASQWIVWKP